MPNQEIENYIKEAKAFGQNDAEIKAKLLEVGWDEKSIDESFISYGSGSAGLAGVVSLDQGATVSPNSMQDNTIPTADTQPKTPFELPSLPEQSAPVQLPQDSAADPMPIKSSVAISDYPEIKVSFASRLKDKLGVLAPVLVLIVIFGLAGAYIIVGMGKTSLGDKLQDHFWQKYLDSSSIPAEHQLSYKYTDSGEYSFKPSSFSGVVPAGSGVDLSSMDEKFSFVLKDLSLAFDIAGFFNTTDITAPVMDATMNFKATEGGRNYEANVSMKANKEAYFAKYMLGKEMLDRISKLAGGEVSPKYSGQWVKLAPNFFAEITPEEKKQFEAEYKKLTDSLRGKRLVNIKYLNGVTMLDGHLVAKYKMEFDKQAFKESYLNALEMSTANAALPAEEAKLFKSAVEKIVDTVLNKFEIDNFQVYIGLMDGKVYKSSVHSNAPSVTGTLALFDKKVKSQEFKDLISSFSNLGGGADSTRYSDTVKLEVALNLYSLQYDGYPAADSSGHPVGLTPDFLSSPLKDVTPPSGKCTEFYNKYWYSTVGTPKFVLGPDGKQVAVYPDFNFTYCLGNGVEGIEGGNFIMSKSGVKPLTSCGTTRPCYETTERKEKTSSIEEVENSVIDFVVNTVKEIPTTASIESTINSSKFNQTKDVPSPTDAVDLFGGLEDLMDSPVIKQ